MYRNIPQTIRQEYGEPISEVIKGFASLGYSKTLTAGTLGMDYQTFTRWLDRLDLDKHFIPNNYNKLCRHYGVKGKAGRKRVYSDEEILKAVARYELAADYKGKPSLSTIEKRFGGWTAAKRKAKEIINED